MGTNHADYVRMEIDGIKLMKLASSVWDEAAADIYISRDTYKALEDTMMTRNLFKVQNQHVFNPLQMAKALTMYDAQIVNYIGEVVELYDLWKPVRQPMILRRYPQ